MKRETDVYRTFSIGNIATGELRSVTLWDQGQEPAHDAKAMPTDANTAKRKKFVVCAVVEYFIGVLVVYFAIFCFNN